jgi:hypothetical protein
MGYWWDRVVLPVRRAWLGVASRFGVRQTGRRLDVGGGSRTIPRLRCAGLTDPVDGCLQGCGGCGRR